MKDQDWPEEIEAALPRLIRMAFSTYRQSGDIAEARAALAHLHGLLRLRPLVRAAAGSDRARAAVPDLAALLAHAPPELEAAFARVKAYLRPECWRDWKGPEFGNEGSRTMAWAREHVQAWLRKLNPEVALIMFGTNDLDRIDADRYADQTRAVARACLDNGTVVILSTIPPRSGAAAKAAACSWRTSTTSIPSSRHPS